MIEAMTVDERRSVGLGNWRSAVGKTWVYRFFERLAAIAEVAPQVLMNGACLRLDAQEFVNALLLGSVADAPIGRAIAIDGTALPTWATMYGESVDADDELPEDGRPAHMHSKKSGKRRPVVRGYGPDGKPIYTADHSARGGHGTATNSKPARLYVGHEGHLAVQTHGIASTNYVDRISFTEDVPNLILGFAIRPGSGDRASAAMDLLTTVQRNFGGVGEVIVDAGYSLLRPETFLFPARSLGFEVVYDLQLAQRGQRPFAGEGLLLDGTLFSAHLPPGLVGKDSAGRPAPLPMPPMRSNSEVKDAYEAPFNERARWRYGVHQGPDGDGYRRLKCPFCTGRLRAREFPKTMRGPVTAPMVFVSSSGGGCCSGSVTFSPADALHMQRIPFGTTAWRHSYARRNVAESVNAGIKCQFVDAEGGFVRALGTTKRALLLGFTLAGYNLYRLDSFRRKQAEAGGRPGSARPKRRRSRYEDLTADRA